MNGTSRHPATRASPAPDGADGRWQVFGLVGNRRLHAATGPTGRRFSGSGPNALTAVVPTHRCGAVPDSHRVPFCFIRNLADEPSTATEPSGAGEDVQLSVLNPTFVENPADPIDTRMTLGEIFSLQKHSHGSGPEERANRHRTKNSPEIRRRALCAPDSARPFPCDSAQTPCLDGVVLVGILPVGTPFR